MSFKFVAGAVVAAAVAGLAALPTTPARAEAGMLTCKSSGNGSFVVISARGFDCTFAPAGGGPLQHYTANVQRFGAQIGFTNDVVLGWAVLAVTKSVGQGALAGTYGGVTGGAAVGIGGNANVLVGGLDNAFTLQPVSLEGETGLNVVATVTGVELQSPAPMRKHGKKKMH